MAGTQGITAPWAIAYGEYFETLKSETMATRIYELVEVLKKGQTTKEVTVATFEDGEHGSFDWDYDKEGEAKVKALENKGWENVGFKTVEVK